MKFEYLIMLGLFIQAVAILYLVFQLIKSRKLNKELEKEVAYWCDLAEKINKAAHTDKNHPFKETAEALQKMAQSIKIKHSNWW